MEKEQFQVENGNFTRILNSIIDNLLKIPFKGCEFEVAMFIIRKTYGFNKTEDEISLTQFSLALNKSRPTIVKALKNLQLVNIALLVKQGDSKICSNCWRFNKYFPTWQLVKLPELVKSTTSTSKAQGLQLVKVPLHTKDNQKTITKDTLSRAPISCLSHPRNGEKMGEAAFDNFWEIYPRKINKIKAKQLFMRLDKSLLPKILDTIEKSKKSIWRDGEIRFIPHPSTWLNQGRWEDEVDVAPIGDQIILDAKKMIQEDPENAIFKFSEKYGMDVTKEKLGLFQNFK